MSKLNIFWFRRDLRLDDNTGLFHALSSGLPVLPVFIFDTNIISALDEKTDKRLSFISFQLKQIKTELEKYGSSLLVLRGKPVEIFSGLIDKYQINAVYVNHDYEPYAINRDQKVKNLLLKFQIPFKSYKDQVIFEKDEILKPDGKPYTIFTPYSKKWKEKLNENSVSEYPSEKLINNFFKTQAFEFQELNCPIFIKNDLFIPNISPQALLHYEKFRNIPSAEATSRVSVHLRFGTLSVRKLVDLAIRHSSSWLNELIWREFFMQILANFPYVINRSFKPVYDQIVWQNHENDFERWCNGETGYPIVDAGMRELNETGFMHNRVRMISASFLTKHLLIDWKWGEAYFASKLIDYELSSNNGNWQWAAGSGCDAAPYFRIFNPLTQTRKFDPHILYIKKWVPEVNLPTYPRPMVEHDFARNRCLQVYSQAIKK